MDGQGVPIIQSQEEIRFLLMVPRDGAMPPSGWPVVMYAHGTGGDYESCRGVSDELLGLGYALVCIDQPLHGSRGPDPEEPLSDDDLVYKSFNFINPPAGRTNFRQSAIDTMVLSRMIHAGRLDRAEGDTAVGEAVVLDGQEIHFFGHSHGGLSGGMVLGIDPLIRSGVLSGAGGGIINTILLRKDPFDIAQLVQTLLNVSEDDFGTFHPTLTLIQMLIDASDPLNYAPYWLHPGDGGTAKHVFVTEGTLDHATSGMSTDSMVAAAGLPLIRPLARTNSAHQTLALEPTSLPVSANIGDQWTGACKQWQDGNHWVAFNNDEAEALWVSFFASLKGDGAPTLTRGDTVIRGVDPATTADGCANAPLIEAALLPSTVWGNTRDLSDHGSVCGEDGLGEGQRDGVLLFTAETAGSYRFRLATPPPEEVEDDEEPIPTGPDIVRILSDCTDAADGCLGTVDEGEVTVDLEADQTVAVWVDGSTPAHVGPFALDITQRCEVEDCGDRECGDWGCGSCGQCAPGSVCAENGQCQTSQVGDACGDPFLVDALPYVHHGETTGFNGDYHYEKGWCSGENAQFGAGSSDVAYRWTVPQTGEYTLRLDADYDAQMYVVLNCDDIENTCLHADRDWNDGEELTIDFQAGETVFVVVDGAYNYSNQRGHYTLRIEGCTPNCTDKACGGDGCGGSCGGCAPLERCVEKETCHPIPYLCAETGVCEALAVPDTCQTATVVDGLPFTAEGTTDGLFDDYKYGKGACPGEKNGYGGNAPDAAFVYTAAEAGVVRFKLTTGFDSNLYVVGDCDAIGDTCLRAYNREKKGGESVYVTLEAGQTVFAIVDGASKDDHAGSYKLLVSSCTPSCDGKVCGSDGCGGSCGGCADLEQCKSGQCIDKVGLDCQSPLAVSTVPYESERDTNDYGDGLPSGCTTTTPGHGEVIYRFTPPATEAYRVWLDDGFAGHLSVSGGCEADSPCLQEGDAQQVLVLDLQQGTPVYVRVEGEGTYTLYIDAVCVPACEDNACGPDGCGSVCGVCSAPNDWCTQDFQCVDPNAQAGNHCSEAHVVATSLPFTGSGNTETSTNQYGVPAGSCGDWTSKGFASNEQVWVFTAAQTGTYQAAVNADFPAVLYAVSDCQDIATTCLGLSDDRDWDRVTLPLSAGQTVYWIIDGASNSENQVGSYTLEVRLEEEP